jgi:hypothetical protein
MALRWLGMGFHAKVTWMPEQIDMDRCEVVVWHSFQLIKNHAPQNMSLET